MNVSEMFTCVYYITLSSCHRFEIKKRQICKQSILHTSTQKQVLYKNLMGFQIWYASFNKIVQTSFVKSYYEMCIAIIVNTHLISAYNKIFQFLLTKNKIICQLLDQLVLAVYTFFFIKYMGNLIIRSNEINGAILAFLMHYFIALSPEAVHQSSISTWTHIY